MASPSSSGSVISTPSSGCADRRGAPVFVQSFETGNLRQLDHVLKVPLVQLLDEPQLHPANDPSTTYGDMATPAGLREIAAYADGVGPMEELHHPAESR